MKQRVWGAFLIVVLVAALAGGPVGAAAAGSSGPWAALVGPAFARFVPGTAEWDLRFGVVGDGWGTAQPKLVAVKAVVDGRACGPLQTAFTRGSWVVASGRLTLAEVDEVTATRLADAQGIPPTSASLPRLEDRAAKLTELLGRAEPGTLSLRGMESLPTGSHTLKLNLTYDVGGKTVVLTTETVVLLAALPPSDGWYAADLHMHSKYSQTLTEPETIASVADLRGNLTSRGYSIGYVTDHAGTLRRDNAFDSLAGPYPSDCRSASTATTWMFPGVEVGVTPNGHTLAYGLIDTSGLPDDSLAAQTALDTIVGGSPIASAEIAHPTHFSYPWVTTEAVHYQGIEVMSGNEPSFGVGSAPVQFWLAQCNRLRTSYPSFLPSVRTGSDFHFDDPFDLLPGDWQDYVTYIQLPTDYGWATASWDDRWGAVSQALKNGRTVVSRKGSLAYLTLDGSPVGSFLPRVAGSQMTFDITLRPVDTGAYTLTLYRDDCAEAIWTSAFCPLVAGAPLEFSVDYTFPGGSHYYWLYVEGSDYCYATPIYVADERNESITVNPDSLTMERGECLQLVATASYGTERDVTSLASWTSSDPSVCAVLGGVVRGGLPGQAVISADFGTAHSECLVTVNPSDPQGLTFQVATEYPAGWLPRRVACGDFNMDGCTDLAVTGTTCEGSVGVGVFLGRSGGGFSQVICRTIHGLTGGIAAADFNNDGRLDLVVDVDGGTAVLMGNGDGSVQPAVLATSERGTGFLPVDLNEDGCMDLVLTAHLSHQDPSYRDILVLLGNGDGTFREPMTYLAEDHAELSFTIVAADFSGDGHVDLAASGEDGLYIIYGSGDGALSLFKKQPISGDYVGVYWAGDLNGDGIPDLVAGFNGAIAVLSGLRGGGFVRTAGSRVDIGYEQVVAADFDRDAQTELASAPGDGSILDLRPDGALWVVARLAAPQPEYGARMFFAGDFDGDGLVDLGYSSRSRYLRISLGLGNGRFRAAPSCGLIGWSYAIEGVCRVPTSMIITDIQGDGLADLVVGNPGFDGPPSVSVLLGKTWGTFEPEREYATPGYQGYAPRVIVADFNGDSIADMAAADTLASVSVRLGCGDGSFGPEVEYVVGPSPGDVVTGDFDADGNADLAVAIGGSDSIAILLGAGDGSFEGPTYCPLDHTSWPVSHHLLAGDFNSDGKTDLLEAGLFDSDNIHPLLSNGDGTFRPAPICYPGSGFAVIVATDFNQDGNLDFVMSSYSLLVLLGNGDGTFRESARVGFEGLPYYYGPNSRYLGPLAVADFNGDGWLDLAAVSLSGDTWGTHIIPGRGDGTFNTAERVLITYVGSALAGGDFTGDDLPDLAIAGDHRVYTFANLSIPRPGLRLREAGGQTTIAEGGGSATYTATLASRPTKDVTVTLGGDGRVTATNATGGAELVFGPATWNIPRTVTVTATDDAVVEGPHSGAITHTASGDGYDGLAPVVLSVSITDNDAPTIIITETGNSTAVLEGPPGAEGTTDTYSVCLGAQPSGTVTVTAAPDEGVVVDNGFGGNTLVFTPADWSIPQTLTVRAVDDAVVEGPHSGRIVHTASGGAYDPAPAVEVDVAIVDDDLPTIVISETGGSTTVTEGGASDTYGVSLGAQPSGPVTITATPDSQVTVDNGRGGNILTFSTANWSVPQSLTVRAVDDLVVESLHVGRITHSASGGAYDLAAAVELAAVITDNDALAAPRTLTAATSANGVRLTWQPPLGATVPTGYEVYIKTTSTGAATKVKDVTTWPGTTPNCEVTALDFLGTGFAFASGRTYYFHLKAYVDSALGPRVVSPVSNTTFTVAGPIPPLPPRSLTGAATATGLKLGWLPALTGCAPQGYQVFIAPTSTGPFTLVKEVTSWDGVSPNCEVTQLDFADGSGGYTFTLTGGKRYAFQVRGFILPSVGGKPTSGPSNTATVTAGPLPPGAPTGLAARTTLLGVGLGWRPPLPTVTAPTPPTGYSVYIAVTSIGPWTFVKDVTTWTGELPNTEVTGPDLDGTGFTMTGGLRYAFRVFSFLTHPLTAQKVSSLMGATTMGVAGPLPPLAPTSLRGTTGADGFGLTWLPPLTGVTPQGYEVRLATTSTGPFSLVKDVTAWEGATPNCQVTSAEIAAGGLAYTPGARYSVRVYAYALHPATMEKLVSARWAVSTVTAGPLPPQAPTGLVGTTALPASGGGVNLTWKPPTMGAVPAGYAVHIAAVSTGPYTFVRNVTSWPGTYPSTQVTAGDCSAVGFPMTAGVRYYFRVYSFIYHPVTLAEIPSLRFGVTSAIAGALP